MLFVVSDKRLENQLLHTPLREFRCVCVNYTEMSDDFAEYVDLYWVTCAGTFPAGVSNLWKVLVFELS